MSEAGVREAGAADAEAVVALWEVCGLTRPWNDPHADFTRAVDGETSAVLLLHVDETLAGSATVGFDGHRGWVYYLAVDPSHRRQGLGRTLMEAAEAWLRTRGAPKIQLMVRSSNEEALAFYRSIGLEPQDVTTLGRFLTP